MQVPPHTAVMRWDRQGWQGEDGTQGRRGETSLEQGLKAQLGVSSDGPGEGALSPAWSCRSASSRFPDPMGAWPTTGGVLGLSLMLGLKLRWPRWRTGVDQAPDAVDDRAGCGAGRIGRLPRPNGIKDTDLLSIPVGRAGRPPALP